MTVSCSPDAVRSLFDDVVTFSMAGNPGNTNQLSGTLVVQNLTIKSTTGRTFVLPVGAIEYGLVLLSLLMGLALWRQRRTSQR